MDKVEQFFEAIRQAPTVTLSTASQGRVTMRLVSPVYHEGAVLIFTADTTKKYRQLQENPHCCIEAGPFFAECTAAFCGATMLDENRPLREAYSAKFPGAFDEGIAFGGRNAAFILLTPNRLSGWAYENEVPNAEGIPTVPFEITLI